MGQNKRKNKIFRFCLLCQQRKVIEVECGIRLNCGICVLKIGRVPVMLRKVVEHS